MSLASVLDSDSFSDPREFIPPPIAETYAGALRFGHTSDFSALFGSTDDRNDYIIGLSWIGVITISIFTLWFACIILFWLMGYANAGFLSGQPFQRTYYYVNTKDGVNNYPPQYEDNVEVIHKANTKSTKGYDEQRASDDDDIYIENTSFHDDQTDVFSHKLGGPPVNKLRNSPRQMNNEKKTSLKNHKTKTVGGCYMCCGFDNAIIVRIIFILSGIGFMFFSVLLVTKGLSNLQDTVDLYEKSASDVANLTGSAFSIIDSGVLAVQSNASTLRTSLLDQLSNEKLCPANPDFFLVNEIGELVRGLAEKATEYLQILDEYANSDALKSVSDTLNTTRSQAESIYDVTSQINVTDTVAFVVLLIGTILPCLMVTSAIMSCFDVTYTWYRCLINWIVFPLFVIIVLLFVLVSGVMSMGTNANSDFCVPLEYNKTVLPTQRATVENLINSPDISVYAILDSQGIKVGTQEFDVVQFYVEQCVAADPYLAFRKYLPDLNESKASLQDLAESIGSIDVSAELTALCDRDFDTLDDSLVQMNNIVEILFDAVVQMLSLLSCDSIVPIYQEAFYDATCDSAVKAMTWAFSAYLIMAFFGFVMITCRASMYETVYNYTYNNSQYSDNYANNYNNQNYPSSPNDDGMTRAGLETTYGANDTVMNSITKYEKENM